MPENNWILDGHINLPDLYAESDGTYDDIKRLLEAADVADVHSPAYALYTQITFLRLATQDPVDYLSPALQARLSTQPTRIPAT